jgi:hypothetical protein
MIVKLLDDGLLGDRGRQGCEARELNLLHCDQSGTEHSVRDMMCRNFPAPESQLRGDHGLAIRSPLLTQRNGSGHFWPPVCSSE